MLCWRVISEAFGLPEKWIKLTKCGRASSILPVVKMGSCDTKIWLRDLVTKTIHIVKLLFFYLLPSFDSPS